MNELKKTSVIIISYNVKELLLNCIKSLYEHCKDSFEIIVVDNNSSDGSVEAITKYFPAVITISNDYNAGFSGANNQGLEICVGDNILLLNPDTEIGSDIIKELSIAVNTGGEKIYAPKLLNADRSLQKSCYHFPGLFTVIAETFFVQYVFDLNGYSEQKYATLFSPDWASGAALYFPRTILNKTGYLNKDLFWMEDVDYCYRASKSGINVRYLPEITIIHYGGKSSEKNLPLVISNQLLSKAKYLSMHKGKIIFGLAMIFILVHIVSRMVIFLLLSPFSGISGKKFNAYLFAMKRYFRYLLLDEKSLT